MSSTSIISRVCGRFNQVTSGLPYIVFSVSFGLMVDMATYGMMVPVLPFRLEATGYKNIPATSSYRKPYLYSRSPLGGGADSKTYDMDNKCIT